MICVEECEHSSAILSILNIIKHFNSSLSDFLGQLIDNHLCDVFGRHVMEVIRRVKVSLEGPIEVTLS